MAALAAEEFLDDRERHLSTSVEQARGAERLASMTVAVINTFIDPALNGHFWPTGIARYGEYMYISDIQTGTVYGYSMLGELVDYLPLGLPDGSLMGIEFDPQGRLYVVDSMSNQVLRIAALPEPPGESEGM